MRVTLEPAINATSKDELRRRLRRVKDLTDVVQIDVVDGRFAKPRNVADPVIIQKELPPEKIHLHLMVEDNAAAIEQWRTIAPRRISFHIESETQVEGLLTLLLAEGIERGLALGPSTALERVLPYAAAIDFLLFVSVPPGRSGQAFSPATIDRIRAVREKFPSLPIGVDGGVTLDLIRSLIDAGATSIAVGSAIFSAKDPRFAITEFQDMIAGPRTA
jgi:ribulose-phosphate 3-epimerase